MPDFPPPVSAVPPSWQVLIGCFERDAIEAALAQVGPILLVPNNLEFAASMREIVENIDHANLYYTEQLLGPEDGNMCWYCYSDFRFDGLVSPEEVRRLVPNLRLLELSLVSVRRLDTLIHEWVGQNPQLGLSVSVGSGRICLHCKFPSSVLAGAEHLVEVIDEFHWWPLGAVVEELEQGDRCFSQWPQPCPFERLVEDSTHPASRVNPAVIWRQNPWLRTLRRQSRLEGELVQAQMECVRLADERDQLTAQHRELAQEMERMRARCAFLRQWPDGPTPQKGDLKLCSDAADPRFGSLLILVSESGEPEVWESANVVAEGGGDEPGV